MEKHTVNDNSESDQFNSRESDCGLSRRETLRLAGRAALFVGATWAVKRYDALNFNNVPQLESVDYERVALDAHVDLGRRFGADAIADGLTYERASRADFALNWTHYHVMSAALDTTELPNSTGDQHFLLAKSEAGLWHYWDGKPVRGMPGYGDRVFVRPDKVMKYLDDNAWDGHALARLYDRTKKPDILRQMTAVFELAVSETEESGLCGSGAGAYWSQHRKSINTISNAPNAMLGFKLYEMTQDESFLEPSHRWMSWVYENMYDRPTGLFLDHINKGCKTDRAIWTYNQGVMIGANTLAFRVSGDMSYLEESQRIIGRSMDFYNHLVPLTTQPIKFNVIYFRNLLYHAAVMHDRALTEKTISIMERYYQEKWPKFIVHDKHHSRDDETIEHWSSLQILAMLAMPINKHRNLV